MSASWNVEVVIRDIDTGESFTVTPDDGPTAEMVLDLADVRARFIYTTPAGKELRCWGDKPWVDPFKCKITYYCEGQRDYS